MNGGVKLFSGQLTFESLSSTAASSAYFLPSTNLSDMPTAHSLGLGVQSSESNAARLLRVAVMSKALLFLLLFESTEGNLHVKGRLPPFYRLDWRVEKRFDIGETGFVTMVLEALNTFLADETLGESCDEKGRCDPTTLGPIVIPSFGVEGGF